MKSAVSRELKQAAFDSGLIAVLFALWGLANVFSGNGFLIFFGIVQLWLSYENTNRAFARWNLSKSE